MQGGFQMRNKFVTIDGIDYKLNGDKLKKQIDKAKSEFLRNKKEKGSFWETMKTEAGISRTTVKEWCAGRIPRDEEYIINLAKYIECDLDVFLEKVQNKQNENGEKYVYAQDGANIDRITSKVIKINDEKEKLRIGLWKFGPYLVRLKGYQISPLALWLILHNKAIPSEELCDDIIWLLDTINYNRMSEKRNPIRLDYIDDSKTAEIKNKNSINRVKMQQLGLTTGAVVKYLQKIRNYKIDAGKFIEISYGFGNPTEEFLTDIDNLLENVEKNMMNELYPLTADQQEYALSKKSINQSYTNSEALAVVFSQNFLQRFYKIEKLKKYIRRNKISSNMKYIHTYRSSTYEELKRAFDLVEMGCYDLILMDAKSDIVCLDIQNRIVQYAVIHNIPIVWLENVYYV